MEWADETITRLRELWSEGHSTAEIGRRLGVSKNAVVGKAHRLELPPRPSPIRREGELSAPRRLMLRRLEGPTLPPLPCTTALTPPVPPTPAVVPPPAPPPAPAEPPASVAPEPEPEPPARPRPEPAPVPASPPRLQAVPSSPSRPYGRVTTCCWPIGEPGTRSFHFCDGPSEPGKPYCEEHAKLAYVRVRDRREDAA